VDYIKERPPVTPPVAVEGTGDALTSPIVRALLGLRDAGQLPVDLPGSFRIGLALEADRVARLPKQSRKRYEQPIHELIDWVKRELMNVVESPFAAVRLRAAAANRFMKVANATAIIWKTLLVAEQSFRRLDAPELLAEVAEGVGYVNGVRAKRGNEKAAA